MNTADYIMRGGTNPNPRGEMIELQIADQALKSYLTNPIHMKKGLKWTYNWFHFLTFYSTSNPDLLNYLFEVQPYPDYIEVETTTMCDMKCAMCMKGDEIISGTKIKDLKIGDKVESRINNWQKVQIPFERNYSGEMITINALGTLPFSLTPEHRVLVSERKWQDTPRNNRKYIYSNPKFIEANKLTRNHALVFPKLKGESNDYSPQFMWFLGLYLAEGCISRNQVILYLGKHEIELIERLCITIEDLFSKKPSVKEIKTCMRISFSHKISSFLKNFGTKAINKHITKPFFMQSEELLEDLIRGFIDGDGCIMKNCVQLTTSSKRLALDFQKLLTRLNVFGRLYVDKREGEWEIQGRKVHVNDLYNIHITRPDIFRFGKFEKKSKKFNMYHKTRDYFYLPIKKLEKTDYTGKVYNIETEDKEYEVNNVIVHNCENTYWKEKAEHMSLKDFTFILDQFPKLKWIGVTGIGQSFLNPDFMPIIKLCKKRGIYVEIFDNFMYLDYEKAKQMVKWGMDKIYVSLDAATKETYVKIRKNSDWEATIKNIKDFDRAKKESNAYYPELWFHFIVSKSNIHELKKYIEMIDKLDVDVKQVQFTRCLHKFKEIKDQFVEIPDKLKNEIVEYAKDFGIKVSWNVNSTENKKPLNVCSLWTMPFIFVDGTVIPCCSLNEQNDRSWQRKTSLGNIFEKPFREIWYGKKYKNMLKGIKEGKCPAECARCQIYDKGKKSFNC